MNPVELAPRLVALCLVCTFQGLYAPLLSRIVRLDCTELRNPIFQLLGLFATLTGCSCEIIDTLIFLLPGCIPFLDSGLEVLDLLSERLNLGCGLLLESLLTSILDVQLFLILELVLASFVVEQRLTDFYINGSNCVQIATTQCDIGKGVMEERIRSS